MYAMCYHARTTFDPYPKMMKMALTSFSPHYGIIGIIKDAINTLGLGTRNLNLGGHFFFDSDIRHDVPFFAHFVCEYSEKSQLVTILRVGFFDDIIGMIKDVSIVS